MRLYEYLIGGKKTGQIDDLKDVIPEGNPFYELKEGETFFVSKFELDGTRVYTDEIEITSIVKKSTYWTFSGFTKKGVKCVYPMWMKDLDKKLVARDQRVYYKVFSTFEMDDEPLFGLTRKEIEKIK